MYRRMSCPVTSFISSHVMSYQSYHVMLCHLVTSRRAAFMSCTSLPQRPNAPDCYKHHWTCLCAPSAAPATRNDPGTPRRPNACRLRQSPTSTTGATTSTTSSHQVLASERVGENPTQRCGGNKHEQTNTHIIIHIRY